MKEATSEALLRALRAGDCERVLELLDAEPELASTRLPGDIHADCLPGSGLPHYAVHANEGEFLRALLRRGAPLDLRNAEGRTALHDAIEFGSRLADELIEAGAEVDVCAAAILGRHERLSELLARDPACANDASTRLSPLGWAAFGNQAHSARLLLDAGARMDDDELLCAASVGHVEVGRFLIERGADPERLGAQSGGNALHVAAQHRYTCSTRAFAAMLLELGCDPHLPDRRGRTALELARAGDARQAREGADGFERDFAGFVQFLEERAS